MAENADMARLRDQALLYRAAFELSAHGQALVDLTGRFLEVNQSLCEILGYSPAELLSRRFLDITHPDDLADGLQAAVDLRSGKLQRYRCEKRYLRPDGRTVWAQVTSHLARDADGQPLYFATVIEDITERKATELAMREREALLSSMGKFVPGLIHKIGFDADGRARFLYISDRAMEMFELPHELMERDYHAHHARVHPDDQAYVKRLATAPKPGALLHPVDFEYRVILPSKGLRVYGGHAIPVTEEDGSVVWYGHTADVTDKKALLKARMAAQVAQDANLAKNEFLSRVSHELRTPLNAVIGFAQLLRLSSAGQLNAAQRQHVEHIESAGSHLLGIISDVLDLSRIEAGDLPLQVQALPLGAVVAEAVNLVTEQARRSQVTLDVHTSAMPWHVQADRVRLRQVLANLLSNAIKYNRADGRVTLSVRPDGAEVCLAVSDTGIGMAPEQLAQLFQPFNRLGVEQSGIEGTGIGLVIVQRLLSLMGGGIHVRSQAGQGSTFEVRLPAASAQAVVAHEAPRVDGPARSGKATILYAEDNEMNVALVHQVVRLRPHWQLLVAMSGKRALEVARRKRPDLMLVDMHLGDMSGIDLARELDADARTAGIPRVALSADAMPDRIRAAREQGFAAYLTKPLDVTGLLRCLDEQLAPDEDG